MDREEYIKKAFQQHLGDENNYKQISEGQALMIQAKMKYKLWEWLKEYGEDLPEGDKRFLITSINVYGDNFARFHMTAKPQDETRHAYAPNCLLRRNVDQQLEYLVKCVIEEANRSHPLLH